MARFFYWLMVSILGFALIVFAVDNHGNVEVSLWPFVETPLTVPLHGLTLISVIVGFIIGAAVGWLQGGRDRRRARELARRIEVDQGRIVTLQEEIERLKAADQSARIPVSRHGAG